MRVVLVEPNGRHALPGFFLRHSLLEPIGLENLASYLIHSGHQVYVIQQRTMSSDDLIKEIISLMPDIVGFSIMTYNFTSAFHLACSLRRLLPGMRIVFGGSHPTACPEIAQHDCIDYVVMGEGERTFIELLNALANEQYSRIHNIGGLAYSNGHLRINQPRPRIMNLDELPRPLRDRGILQSCRVHSLSYPPPSEQRCVAQITYSRGCPFHCSFCASPKLWGKDVVFRSPESVVDEILHLQEQYGTNLLFFTDLTFNLVPKRVAALCKEIIKRGVDINWFTMCRVQNLDRETVRMMKKAGCYKIAFGIDALDSESITRIKKGNSYSLSQAKDILQMCSDEGVIVRGYLMIGYPWDTLDSLRHFKNALVRFPLDDLRISFFTPLPGSTTFDKWRNNGLLLTKDWSRFTTDEPIIKIPALSPADLIEIRHDIFYHFYSSNSYARRRDKKLRRFPILKNSYNEFSSFLLKNGIIDR